MWWGLPDLGSRPFNPCCRFGLKGGGCGVGRCRSVWRLGWWSLLLPSPQGQWHDSLNMTCLRLQVFGQMTWDIKRVFPYYKRTQVLKDLKTPTPRKTDTSPETTHCHPDHVMSRDICPHMSRDFLGFWGGCFGSFVRFGFGVFQDICPFFGW